MKEQSVEERYLSLEEKYPGALQRIPVKYIAGYLGIEPESLSRFAVAWQEKQNNLG